MQGAHPWLLGGNRLQGLLAWGKRVAGPWDRHEEHRGAASPAHIGQIRLATCSSHQKKMTPNCSIHHHVWEPSRDKNESGAPFQESDLPSGGTA